MNKPQHIPQQPELNLAQLRRVPRLLILIGGILGLVGAGLNLQQFGYAWLLAFLFYLSLSVGALCLVIFHHLFDASWSVPIRRILEHIACLFPVLALFFIPIAALAPTIYPWMSAHPQWDAALHSKALLLKKPVFYGISAGLFLLWTWLSWNLRKWSIRQDQTSAANCTFKMRQYSAGGAFLMALTVTAATTLWMNSLQPQWFSATYGVGYFSGSIWFAVAMIYVIAVIFQKMDWVKGLFTGRLFYFMGLLLLAFTLFQAYILYSQYFLIWNAGIPEETFWFVQRDQGDWGIVGLILIIGLFLIPFVVLLRIDTKLKFRWMLPLCVWIALMHYLDLAFQIMPVIHPEGFPLRWLWVDIGCLAFMGGILGEVFIRLVQKHPFYPIKDPRLSESMGIIHPMPTGISGGELDPTQPS